MQSFKVCFCIPNMVIGGVESVFIQTLDDISKKLNADITVIMHTPLQEQFFIDWFNKHPHIKLYTLYPMGTTFERLHKYMHFFPLSNIRKIIYSIYKKIKNHAAIHSGLFSNCDIIIDYKNCAFFKLMKLLPNKKITWIHGSINYFNENNLIERINTYDKIVCITKSFLNDFAAQYPKYKNKIIQIYNPINYKGIKETSAHLSILPEKYFCTVSRLDSDKDINTIIKAFDVFWHYKNKPDVKLIIVGNGGQADELKKYVATLDCHDNIIFTGSVPVPFGYMRGAMAHILSSNNEGLGMVMLESAACETLNIASDCKNGPAEILMNGEAGLLFTPGDTTQLAKLMQQVWDNNIPRETMIKKATENLKNFSSDKITAEIINLILNTARNK